MEKEKNELSLALEIANKCIGMGLEPVKATQTSEEVIIEQQKAWDKFNKENHSLADDEEANLIYDLLKGEYRVVIDKIEPELIKDDIIENWHKSLNEKLTQEDWDILCKNTGYDKDKIYNWEGEIGWKDKEHTQLVLSTSWRNWAALAGRKYVYNTITKKVKLLAMS